MKTVSQEFKDILARGEAEPMREVSMKRRYWDQATRSYLWEAAWTVIPGSEIVSVSPIVGQLDTEIMNEFKVSNVTLTLKNQDNRWKPDNPAGKFAQDATISLYPFEPYFTKFRVRASVRLAAGTEEYVSLFTGLLVEMTAASDDQVQMTVQGLESLLQNANAENVSTRVVNETIGTGNGILKDFTTIMPGVGIIEEVSVAGIAQEAGDTTWSVSQLNEVTLGAKITFVTAPASGTIRCTYRYWKQLQSFEDLISDLLTEAGIPEADQIIDSVMFPGSVLSSWTQDSQGDWLAGTFSGTEGTGVPGDVVPDWTQKALLDDFTDGDYTANPAWTKRSTFTSWSAATGRLHGTAERYSSTDHGPRISTPSDRVIGTWSLKFNPIKFPIGSTVMMFTFMADGWNGVNEYPNNGYSVALYIPFPYPSNHTLLALKKYSSGVEATLGSPVVYDATRTPSEKTIKITRTVNGLIQVYVDDVLLISQTDATFSSSNIIGISCLAWAGDWEFEFDDIYTPPASISPSFISQTLNIGSVPVSFGKLTYDETLTGAATSTFYTRTSADGSSWDTWTAISGTGQIMSTPKQYLQVKWAPSIPSNANNNAVLHSFTAQYATASTTIALANFTGKTCYDAIQELGKFANYEWGFTADEDFFFQSKEVAPTQDIVLARETNISEISGMQTGWDRVYSEVRTTYGAFSKTLKTQGDTPGDPLARFKSRILEIDGGDIMLSADGNVASGVAGIFFAYFAKPRRRFKAKCKFIPQMDLSDVALVRFNNNLPRPVHFPGDESHYYGEPGLRYWGPGEQLAGEMLCKVIGTRYDAENWNSEFDLEEIVP